MAVFFLPIIIAYTASIGLIANSFSDLKTKGESHKIASDHRGNDYSSRF